MQTPPKEYRTAPNVATVKMFCVPMPLAIPAHGIRSVVWPANGEWQECAIKPAGHSMLPFSTKVLAATWFQHHASKMTNVRQNASVLHSPPVLDGVGDRLFPGH
ncbi:hypothetical protein [Leptodesmis sp.]|uniref:hypothetical protein n=1 Tax=Leptodesmis sp. TaxID=3100501 RepID=UPI004053506A